MRSELDKSFAGAGTEWAYYEDREGNLDYQNHYIEVILPYDHLDKDERESLHGRVKSYTLSKSELEALQKNRKK